MKKTLHFWIEAHSATFDDAYPLEVDWLGDDDDVRWAAEQYAEHHHYNHDGWEDIWPIIFTVATPDGKILGRVSVERESRPHFYGTTVK